MKFLIKKQYKQIIPTLKYISNFQLLMKYKTWNTDYYFSDFVVLKKNILL
jgi:hypothetical protein